MIERRMSIQQYRKLTRKKGLRRSRPKYGNVKTVCDSGFPEIAGRRFDSQFEKAVAIDLVVRLRAGEIEDLRFQDTVHMTKADVSWRIDFSYVEKGVKWYHEVKGFPDDVYPLKLKLYKVYGKEKLRITNGSVSYRKTEEVYPKGEV